VRLPGRIRLNYTRQNTLKQRQGRRSKVVIIHEYITRALIYAAFICTPKHTYTGPKWGAVNISWQHCSALAHFSHFALFADGATGAKGPTAGIIIKMRLQICPRWR